MKIAVICNSAQLSLAAIHYLQGKKLVGVCFPESSTKHLMQPLLNVGVANASLLPLIKQDWHTTLANWLKGLAADVVFVFAFPYRIPEKLLSIPLYGFYNFHFGLLPKYKGADPIFWQLKNQEPFVGLTIHQMDKEIDCGPIASIMKTPLLEGENYSMQCARLGYACVAELQPLIEAIATQQLKPTVQEPDEALYLKRPQDQDFRIDWQRQSAKEIMALVNACNDKYGGATTFLGEMELRILEVGGITTQLPTGQIPGQIVHADHLYGLVVACTNNEFLKINIVHTQQGYLSGSRLFSMGVQQGQQLI